MHWRWTISRYSFPIYLTYPWGKAFKKRWTLCYIWLLFRLGPCLKYCHSKALQPTNTIHFTPTSVMLPVKPLLGFCLNREIISFFPLGLEGYDGKGAITPLFTAQTLTLKAPGVVQFGAYHSYSLSVDCHWITVDCKELKLLVLLQFLWLESCSRLWHTRTGFNSHLYHRLHVSPWASDFYLYFCSSPIKWR